MAIKTTNEVPFLKPENNSLGWSAGFVLIVFVALFWGAVSFASSSVNPLLSSEEKQWLVEHPKLRLGVGVALPPFMWVEKEDGQMVFKGMVADYIDLLSKKLDIEMEVVLDIPFNEALERGRTGQIDLFPCLTKTPERSKILLFTEPYLSYPLVIVAREDAPVIGGIEDLSGKRLAIVKHLMAYSKLQEEHKVNDIDFVFTNTVLENLEAVSTGMADVSIINLAVASYFIQKKGLTNLRIASAVHWEGVQYSMGTRKDWPMLHNIISKAQSSITQQEKDQISTRWIRMQYDTGVNVDVIVQWFLAIAMVMVVFFAFFLIWNRRLRNEISERQSVEKALKENERKLQALIGNLPGIVYSCTNEPEWKMLYISDGCSALTGYAPSELVFNNVRSYNDLIVPEDREYVQNKIQAALKQSEPFTIEYRILTRDNNEKWVWERGQRVAGQPEGQLLIEGLITDITERKRYEAERERLKMAIEQSGEIIVITDSTGTIQFVNRAFEKETGYTRYEAIGQNPRILKSGKQDEKFYDNLWATISGGQIFQGRIINKRKNGTLYTEFATISPVVDHKGEIISYVAVKRDITLHLQMEKQLHQAQKMDSIGQLAGGVAHDYNNMLSVIIGYTELVMDQVDQNGNLYEELMEIRAAASRSADITRQLLGFARKQTVVPEVLDLNDVVENALKMLLPLIGEDIEMVWQPKADLWQVKIDPTQLEQILTNLCVNARQAIKGVGKIVLETNNVIFDELYCSQHVGTIPGEYVQLMVTDDGCGISKKDQQNIFEPFFTTKDIGEGTGLGLATVYGIVKQNNGYVYVYSELSKGSTFKIYLPRHLSQDGVRKDASQETDIPEGHGETILVVEDEPATLKLTKRILSGLGYTVIDASTTKQALDFAKENQGEIQVLLTDVIMPEMNGRELATAIRALCPKLKVLFMSGYTADIIARQGVLPAGVNFIQKPFTKKDLANEIREVLGDSG